MPTKPTRGQVRGPTRASLTLNVDTGDSEETFSTFTGHERNAEDSKADKPPSDPKDHAQQLVATLCSLGIHDENFSMEDVMLDVDLFPKDTIKSGDLVEIAALRANVALQESTNPGVVPKGASNARSGSSGTDRSANPLAHNAAAPRGHKNPRTLTLKGSGTQRCDKRDFDPQKRYIFVVKEMNPELKLKHHNLQELQISLSSYIASAFGFKNRMQVMVSKVDEAEHTASCVELSFRDEYLARADMWRLAISELAHKSVYKGQRILFMGTIKATVKRIFAQGRKVRSAYFSSSTKPIFRSDSARYVLFIQMSKEMWDFDVDGTGEIMFNKVINGFLPELFKRWEGVSAHHLVSIVLFTRMDYASALASGASQSLFITNHSNTQDVHNIHQFKDFYRVVVSDMASGEWTSILLQLKREFKVFLRDVSVITTPSSAGSSSARDKHSAALGDPETLLAGRPSVAVRGNILEAINLACSQFSHDYIDRDLVRTGVSIVVITTGTGVFEVDYNMLALTTETVIGIGIGIDLVCLSRMPLHSVPLFKYKPPAVLSKLKGSYSQPATSGDITYCPQATPFGSFSNGMSAISPSRPSAYGPNSSHYYKPSQSPAVSEHWSYAIPHWIDVSFWTSTWDEAVSDGNNKRGAGSFSLPNQELSEAFQPRVCMYELQMMGVMENEMSNISIPYLQEDTFHPRKMANPYVAPEHPNSKRLQARAAVKEPANGKRLSQSAKDTFQWMDDYDDTVFHPLALRQEAERTVKLKPRISEPMTNQRPSLEDSSVLGTSAGYPDLMPRGSNPLVGAAYFDRRMKERERSKEREVPKISAGNTSTVGSGSKPKPTRLSRQISFGLRGIGVVAPKAIASTELTSEHAKPGPSTARGVLTQSSSPTSGVILSSKPPSTSLAHAKTVHLQDGSISGGTSLPMPGDGLGTQPSRPIAIKVAMKQRGAGRLDRNKISPNVTPIDPEIAKHGLEKLGFLHVTAITKSADRKLDLAANAHGAEAPICQSPTSALSPWITILDPSNPSGKGVNVASQFGRWQHVSPHGLRTSSVKWKSLCSPAALPLTTEDLPTADQLATDYQENPYRIARNDDDEMAEIPRSIEAFMRELVAFRLSRGFQVVVGLNVAQATGQPSMRSRHILDSCFISESGTTVFLSKGNTIHRILHTDGSELEITGYVRRSKTLDASTKGITTPVMYRPAIRTILEESYADREIVFQTVKEEYNWNYVDNFIAGFKEQFTDQLRFWCARFVLIPVDPSSSVRRPLQSLNEDNEEEIRLEGIRKLTQMWQRYRYVPPEERRFQAPIRKRKGTNPLDIMYQTRNPSDVVAAELDSSVLAESETGGKPTQLLPDSDLFQRSNLSLSTLAQTIQGEKGIRMMDRRWHWRLHYNCFIGFEFTSWLLQSFRDVDTRDEAVVLGNDLMKNGLFQHVEKRHNFRDGNFFYQIASEHRIPRPESRSGWFGTRKSEKSVPSTPMSDNISKESPHAGPSRPNSRAEDGQPKANIPEPAGGTKKKLEVALSKVMRYDVDYRKKSYRPEFVNLHYDRLHNPDNCYHIRIDWMNVTSKLIEDAIVSWATSADKFGLRLVEVPIGEASSISDTHPFRAPYLVKLVSPPPEKQPQAYFDATSFSPQVKIDRYFYQKAIMKKFNFVLDLEAAKDFPEDVKVSYSWGKPDYRFPQYIHRSGVLLAQITDDGDFLLLANRLYNNRSAAAKESTKYEKSDHDRRPGPGPGSSSGSVGLDRLSPFSSPLVRATVDVLGGGFALSGISTAYSTPETVKNDLEAFCADVGTLGKFYDQVLTKAMSPGPNTPFLDRIIPSIGLPPNLSIRDASALLSPNVEAVAGVIQSKVASDGSLDEYAAERS
ncbi:MAG: vacuolar membrane-associated protein iml1 [Pleopsidium flavum]|nr:MAG: vacuolar membrane-associated protein iml1 [Pleopsidium flavum]